MYDMYVRIHLLICRNSVAGVPRLVVDFLAPLLIVRDQRGSFLVALAPMRQRM